MDFQDYTVLGPLASYHFDRQAGHNEVHPGLGLMHPSGWAAGYYKNSHRRPSFYAGKEFNWPLTRDLSAALMLGGATGYDYAPVAPMVLPSMIYDLPERHQLALMFMPPVGKRTQGGLALQYRYKMK